MGRRGVVAALGEAVAPEAGDVRDRPDPLAQRNPDDPGRYFGKYRGVVLDNVDIDPEFLGCGRVLVEVPQVPGSVLNWAMPSVPYAGLEVGFWMIPPIGANVWVEFEGGNPNFPIWSGCFWELGEFPFAVALNPLDPALVKIVRTDALDWMVKLGDTPMVQSAAARLMAQM